MEEVTDPGSNGSPPGTHRKKIYLTRAMLLPLVIAWRRPLLLHPLVSQLFSLKKEFRDFNPQSAILDVGSPDNTGEEKTRGWKGHDLLLS